VGVGVDQHYPDKPRVSACCAEAWPGRMPYGGRRFGSAAEVVRWFVGLYSADRGFLGDFWG
jgi:hypothetical protein